MEARLLSPEVSNSGQQRRPAGALEGLPEEPARSQMIGQVRVRVTPSTGWIFGTTSLPSSSSSRSPVPGTEFSCRLACGRWSDRGWHRRRPASPGRLAHARVPRTEHGRGCGSDLTDRSPPRGAGRCTGCGLARAVLVSGWARLTSLRVTGRRCVPYAPSRDRPGLGCGDGRLELPRFGLEFRQPHIGIERPAVEIFPDWLGPEVVGILGEVPPVDARCSTGGRRDRDGGS